MKFDMKFKDVCEIHCEKEPMDMEKFKSILYLLAGLMGCGSFIGFFALLLR